MLRFILVLLAGAIVGAAASTAYFITKRGAASHPEEGGHDDHDHGAHAEGEKEGEEGVVKLSEEARKASGIRAVSVAKQKLGAVLTTTANVRPNADRLAHVSSKVGGRIVEILATQGTRVKQGEDLLSLDSIEVGNLATDLLQAKSGLEVAQANYERERQLMDRKATTAVAFYEAKAQMTRIQAEFQAARDKLLLLGWTSDRIQSLNWSDSTDRSRVTVVAPIEGEVIEKHATLGEVVAPENNLFTIADLSTVWIEINVYQRDAGRVHVKQPVEATAEGQPGRTFKGHVHYVGRVVDEETRTLKVRVVLDNKEGLLKSGMFVAARILDDQDEHAREVVAVPESSVQRIANVAVVFIQKAPGLYERRAVTLGERYGDYFEVVAGLEGGETIVTNGSFILKSELLRAQMEHGHEH